MLSALTVTVLKVVLRSGHAYHYLVLTVLLACVLSSMLAYRNLFATQSVEIARRVRVAYYDVRLVGALEDSLGGCTVYGVAPATICTASACARTWVLVPLAWSGLGPGPVKGGVALGERVASLLGASRGSMVSVDGLWLSVVGVYRTGTGDDLVAVVPEGVVSPVFFEVRCPGPVGGAAVRYVELVSRQASEVVSVWLGVSLVVALAGSLVSLIKLLAEVRGEIEAIAELGAPTWALTFSLAFSALALSAAASVVGASMGVVASQAAAWCFRALGIVFVSRPFLTAWDVASVVAVVSAPAPVGACVALRLAWGGAS